MIDKTDEQIRSAYRTLDAALAHRNAFDMDMWVSSTGGQNVVTLADLEENECGTTACYAGWHAALAGKRLLNGSGLFVNEDRVPGMRRASDFTAEDLGLTDSEYGQLFYCEDDEIENMVEKIFGPRPADMPLPQERADRL